MDQDVESLEPQDLKYKVKTHVKTYRTWVKPSDDPTKPKYETKLLFLVLDDTTENSKFLEAWYPKYQDQECMEVICLIGSPIHAPARFAVMRPDSRCHTPYLVCLSPGVSKKILERFKEGETLLIESQKQDDEDYYNDQIPDLDADIEAEE